jgi:hypothetical protein
MINMNDAREESNRKPTSEERTTSMENAERVTRLHPQSSAASAGEMVPRPQAAAARRDQRQEVIVPIAVSQSSYFNEKDRHYRAAETVANGTDLAERSINGVLRLDAKRRQAEADGASPRALAAIERLEEVLGHTTAMIVYDFGANPYERW